MEQMSSQEQNAGHGARPESGVEVPHGDPVSVSGHAHGGALHLPAPTAWPIVTAFGFTLLVGGILLHYVISIAGFVLLVIGCVGWFKDVLPHELHENVTVKVQEVEVASSRNSVARIPVDPEHRAHLPLHTFSITAGLKGGIAGGIAMIIPALIYGLIAQHSIWYTVNLLGGAGVGGWSNPTAASLRAFHAEAFGIAIVIQVTASCLIGLVYGSLLPMLPKHPILLGGILAPLVWSGLLWATLPTINPTLSHDINWAAFLISQFTFGLVAGWVVSRSEYVRTSQSLPFNLRLGLHGGGLGHHEDEERH